MRITFVLPTVNRSGGIRVAAIYAQRLRQRGHDVVVVSPPAPRKRFVEKVRTVARGELCNAMHRRAASSWFDDIDIEHRVIERWRPIGDGDVPDADMVVATWWETAEWVYALSPRKGAKAYLVQHHEVFDYLPVGRVRSTYRMPLRKIAVSQWLRDVLVEQYGPQEIEVVPNAVDAAEFFAEPRGKQATPTVGMMYSEVAWKNSKLGLAAVELARRQMPNLKLVMFGQDRPRGGELPAGATFHHRPTPELMRQCYGGCDAWLFTSTEEGFGLPILEAMACRTPVIATPAGAAPQLLFGDSPGGVLLSDFRAETMAKAIVDVARMSDSAWRQMSDRAHATATSYTWDDATDLFEAALERIARGNRENPGENGESGLPAALSSAVDAGGVRESSG